MSAEPSDIRERLEEVFGDPDEELTLEQLIDNALRSHAVGWGYAGQESMIREAHEKVAAIVVDLLDRMKPWAQWPRPIHHLLLEITLALGSVPPPHGDALPSPVAPLRRAAHLVKHLCQQVPEFTGVIGPAGEREDDYIRDGLMEEAIQWERLADRLAGYRVREKTDAARVYTFEEAATALFSGKYDHLTGAQFRERFPLEKGALEAHEA